MFAIAPDRKAFVTGAASGFGLGVSERLIANGARVAMADLDGDLVHGQAERLGGAALPIVLDVRDATAVRAGVDAAVAAFGGLDTLVNCAGVFEYGALAEMTEAHWDRMLDVNLKGTFLVAQAAMPHLVTSGRGRLVNISSEAGRKGWPLTSAYNAAKFGVIGLTQTWAREFGRDGVTVNAVCPAMTPETGQGQEVTRQKVARTGQTEAAVMRGYAENFPLGRAGTVADTADAILFLISSNAGWITGISLDIDGGGPAGSQPLPTRSEETDR
ncbi:MAG TPA: SDR family NAD(P)-dependent oxidoreductase [Candidatus Limnocylindrales bacterium]|nr:SDR family NAD(P)-dependent oxidoreductase [Candidatus Limnocylindrales bacterium]